jgi:hypothetical protein
MFNGIMPAISQSQNTINDAASAASDRIGSRIEIIQAGANGNQMDFWIKNIGTVNIPDIQNSNVFLSAGSNLISVNFGGPATPYWSYALTGSSTEWSQASTIHVTVITSTPLTPGSYKVKFVIANGISDETSFSVQ